jgi:LPS-assembly lipoprotein
MKRRTFAVTASSLFLAACGFQLRQAPTFAFKKIYINASAASPIAQSLKKAIASSGNVTVVDNPTQADVILDVLGETRQKVVVGLSAVGQVTEFEIRMRFRFKLRTPQGRELIPDSEIAQNRDISFTESAALAKEAEEQLIYRDMQADVVLQTMRRLAAAKLA